jgi:hypothetical protein
MGEAVDLLVVAFARAELEGTPQVSVSVEPKCCWHRDLGTAMQEQLVDRYLDADQTQGIYVVAHFQADTWSDNDRQFRSACARRDLDTSREFFVAQAAAISRDQLAEISSFVLDCHLRSSGS